MRQAFCVCAAVAAVVAPALAGSTFTFSADIYGRTADSGRLAAGLGDFTILDLYLANDQASDLRLLSVFNVDIALDAGAFVHHDADSAGHWSAAYNVMGANTAIDSFATFGAMSGDDPFLAALDPNFSGAVAGSVSANAGWYNDDPTNGQGNVVAGGQVFVGRFVVANDADTERTFTVSGELSYNFQSPGVYFDSDSQVFTLPAATPVVPGPLALAAIAGIGLTTRDRRRRA
ncbi:MAG: hypothetical protein VX726_12490 [Planctomycetota bacterium]|nr:hypothetical protein [Planctomycetota bacterium]